MHVFSHVMRRGINPSARTSKTTASRVDALHFTAIHPAGAPEIPRTARCLNSLQHAAAAQIVEVSDGNAPPDVMPHVFLAFEPCWSSSDGSSQHNAKHDGAQRKKKRKHQEESCVLPRTSARLQGMQLPGFIPRLTAQEDPQLTLWKQQSAVAWHTTALWAQQIQQWQQQQQTLQLQQQHGHTGHEGSLQPQLFAATWLQPMLAAGSGHWGPAAAVLDAAGPRLQLQHLIIITQTLAEVIAGSSSSGRSSSSGTESAVDIFKPNVLAIEPGLQYREGSADSSRSTGSSTAEGSVKMLRCTTILPQLSSLLLQQIYRPQEQQQWEVEQASTRLAAAHNCSNICSGLPSDLAVDEAGMSTVSSTLDSSGAVCLLQQLALLQATGKLGTVDAAVVAELVFHHVPLLQCSLSDLATLVHSCGQLGHPFRTSWLAAFIQEALDKLQQQQQEVDGVMAGVLIMLLDGLSMYPGPHMYPEQLAPFLTALHHHLSTCTSVQLHQLLTAVGGLGMQPSELWLEAAAAAVEQQFSGSSFEQLVLLLQGMTALMSQPEGWSLKATWWQAWFEATASRCAAVSLAASAGAAAGGKKIHTSGTLAAVTWTFGRAASAAAASSPGEYVSSGPSGWGLDVIDDSGFGGLNHPSQLDVVSAEVLFDALLVLLRVKQPVHPLWLAGTLEAYHRRGYSISSTPQLLLLVSDLLDNPPVFAVRHRALLNQLIQPLAQSLAELDPEQLTQAVEVCAVFQLSPGADWFRWHSAAIMRLNTTFPLQPLARAAEAYRQLQQVPDDHRLHQLFKSIPWRLSRQERRQKAQQRLDQLKATITFKNEQRRSQNMRDKEDLERKKMKWQQRVAQKWGVGGNGVPPAAEGAAGQEGKQQWRKRKLKPSGTLDRKF